MAQGLLPEPQPQFGVSPEDLPRYAPGPLAEEMLQQPPHKSIFEQGLSRPNLFPTSMLGSTRPTRSETGETIWTTDLGVEETPVWDDARRGYYTPATGQINLHTSPDNRYYAPDAGGLKAVPGTGQYRARPVVPTQSMENAPLGFAAGSHGTSTYPDFHPN